MSVPANEVETGRVPRGVSVLARQPGGLATLFFTEAWERFSYYGMRALLMLFMVAPAASGGMGFDLAWAARVYGNYTMAVYTLAIFGGQIADKLLGAKNTVLIGGIIVACGHFTLAVEGTGFFYAGLALVATGTGLLKPNATAMVGSLYPPQDPRREAGYSIFYMGINLGAYLAPLLTGFLAQSALFKAWLAAEGFDPNGSWHWGFGAAGVGMTVGLVIYVMRLPSLAGIGERPKLEAASVLRVLAVLAGSGVLMALLLLSDQPGFTFLRILLLLLPLAVVFWFAFRRDADSQRLGAVAVFFIVATIFWAVYEQAGSTIALFAEKYVRTDILGWSFPSTWFQSCSPFFVVLLAPLFAWLWLRLGERQPATPLKLVLSLFFLTLSLLLMIPAAHLTGAGLISPLWIIALFLVQVVAELFLGPVTISVLTRLTPPRMIGLVMGVWLLSLAWGNKLAGVMAGSFDDSSAQARAEFFLHQGILVGVCTVLLLLLVPWLKKLMCGVR